MHCSWICGSDCMCVPDHVPLECDRISDYTRRIVKSKGNVALCGASLTLLFYNKILDFSRLVKRPALPYTQEVYENGIFRTDLGDCWKNQGGVCMEQRNWLEAMAEKTLAVQVLETNRYTQKYGLVLGEEDATLLARERADVLRAEKRIEFGQGILPKIIYNFCDSAYIYQDNYCESLIRLQEIFFQYKNEMMDEITDDELLEFMKEQFENVCCGDFGYLEGTCLDLFAQAIRAGYTGYQETQGRREFGKVDIVKRWDKDLYLEALYNLF